MNSADEIKRMEELKKLEQMKREALSKSLTREAMERLGRVRAVNQYLASQVEMYVVQIYNSGRLKQPITEGKLKEILALLSSNKPNFNIKRK